MARKQLISPATPLLDKNGDPLSGGTVVIRIPGTSTDSVSFSKSDLSVANTNPVNIPSDGRVNVWVDRDVDYLVYDADSNLIFTETNANPSEAIQEDTGVLLTGRLRRWTTPTPPRRRAGRVRTSSAETPTLLGSRRT